MKNVKGKMTKNQEKDKIAESTIHICEHKSFL